MARNCSVTSRINLVPPRQMDSLLWLSSTDKRTVGMETGLSTLTMPFSGNCDCGLTPTTMGFHKRANYLLYQRWVSIHWRCATVPLHVQISLEISSDIHLS